MSYEGYSQILCRKGHQSTEDAYGESETFKCPVCGEPKAWSNQVDLTNGSFDEKGERIDGYIELEIKEPAVTCKCPTCNNVHVVQVQTYKIPKKRKRKT